MSFLASEVSTVFFLLGWVGFGSVMVDGWYGSASRSWVNSVNSSSII